MRTTKEERDANRIAVDVTEDAGRIALPMCAQFVRALLDDADEADQLREALAASEARAAAAEQAARAAEVASDFWRNR